MQHQMALVQEHSAQSLPQETPASTLNALMSMQNFHAASDGTHTSQSLPRDACNFTQWVDKYVRLSWANSVHCKLPVQPLLNCSASAVLQALF